MVYLKFLNGTNHFNNNFRYGFDSLCGTELKESLNAIFSGYFIGHSLIMMQRMNMAKPLTE